MSDLVPVLAGGPQAQALQRLRSVAGQPAVRAALPWFAGVAALGAAALAWSVLAPESQRVLYTQLDDRERASVVEALDKASIGYTIDNQTGALSVGEGDLYRARMTVAADGALAAADPVDDPLSSLPMGASRTLEGQRLNAARERELVLSIAEIDGVEAVRVHLAEAEKSAFVRDNAPASASVMLRLARGRQLSPSQVKAIVNLVAGSVPGLALDAVKVIDQHGALLSDPSANDPGRIELQARIEDTLHSQLTRLLTPMIGEGNFSAQVHADLDMDEVTSARESYDKQGVLRSESQQQSQTGGTGGVAFGVPGALSNTPPPQTVAQAGAPVGTAAPAPAPVSPQPTNGDSSATRTYELGREVAVTNATPGKIKRLSVAVAISAAAMKGTRPTDIAQIKQLVVAAVGADLNRGDDVAVMVRKFDAAPIEELPFYEQSWFATAVRYGAGLIAMLLVLMLAVRPLIRNLQRDPDDENEPDERVVAPGTYATSVNPAVDAALLGQQISLAQRMVSEQPESAIEALRRMLQAPARETER
jgi:flagellar M-ring protein FliF